MSVNKFLNFLGLAKRAGAIVTGEDTVIESLRHGKVKLIILASDTGPSNTKKVNDKASFYKCDVISDYTSDEISCAIGAKGKKIIGITNEGFAKKMKEIR